MWVRVRENGVATVTVSETVTLSVFFLIWFGRHLRSGGSSSGPRACARGRASVYTYVNSQHLCLFVRFFLSLLVMEISVIALEVRGTR